MFLIFRVIVISTNMCPISIPYSVDNFTRHLSPSNTWTFQVSLHFQHAYKAIHCIWSNHTHTSMHCLTKHVPLFWWNSSWLHPYIWDLTPFWAFPYIPLILWIFSALVFQHASFFLLPIWREGLCFISLCFSSPWQYNSFHLVKE